jgi:regulator of protease activity HflC (stomatin/prohibitin superfamily)
MQIDAVIFYKITDSKLYCYGIENPLRALENLTSTTLRNIIGDLELDETLTSRDIINSRMREILDIATDPWGIKVTRVELKNILPPKDIRESMEKQMRAEREKRQTILIAEGDKQAKILQAEGAADSKIIQAEGEKRARILDAEGQAESILKIQGSEAKAIELLRLAKPDGAVLTLKQYEALIKVADGKATKIFLPSDIGSGFSSLLTIAESLKEKDEVLKKETVNPLPKIPNK